MDLEKLRTICLSFPGATEGIKWENHLCFMIAGKMFCITSAEGTSFKATPKDFHELTQRAGVVPLPYLSRGNWVRAQKLSKLSLKEWEYYIARSYKLVFSKLPKKVQLQFTE